MCVCKHGVCVCVCVSVCVSVCVCAGGAEASRGWFTPAVVIRTYLAYCMTDNNFTAAFLSDEQ